MRPPPPQRQCATLRRRHAASLPPLPLSACYPNGSPPLSFTACYLYRSLPLSFTACYPHGPLPSATAINARSASFALLPPADTPAAALLPSGRGTTDGEAPAVPPVASHAHNTRIASDFALLRSPPVPQAPDGRPPASAAAGAPEGAHTPTAHTEKGGQEAGSHQPAQQEGGGTRIQRAAPTASPARSLITAMKNEARSMGHITRLAATAVGTPWPSSSVRFMLDAGEGSRHVTLTAVEQPQIDPLHVPQARCFTGALAAHIALGQEVLHMAEAQRLAAKWVCETSEVSPAAVQHQAAGIDTNIIVASQVLYALDTAACEHGTLLAVQFEWLTERERRLPLTSLRALQRGEQVRLFILVDGGSPKGHWVYATAQLMGVDVSITVYDAGSAGQSAVPMTQRLAASTQALTHICGCSSTRTMGPPSLMDAEHTVWVFVLGLPASARPVEVLATDHWPQVALKAGITLDASSQHSVLTPTGPHPLEGTAADLRAFGRRGRVAWAAFYATGAPAARTLRVLSTTRQPSHDSCPHLLDVALPPTSDPTWDAPLWDVLSSRTGIHEAEVDAVELWAGYVDFRDISHKHTLRMAWDRLQPEGCLTVHLITDELTAVPFRTAMAPPQVPSGQGPPADTAGLSSEEGKDDVGRTPQRCSDPSPDNPKPTQAGAMEIVPVEVEPVISEEPPEVPFEEPKTPPASPECASYPAAGPEAEQGEVPPSPIRPLARRVGHMRGMRHFPQVCMDYYEAGTCNCPAHVRTLHVTHRQASMLASKNCCARALTGECPDCLQGRCRFRNVPYDELERLEYLPCTSKL